MIPLQRKQETLGQVFTPPAVVRAMLVLRQNSGRVLEPSCGDGAFVRALVNRPQPSDDLVAIECDEGVAPIGAQVGDFFAYPTREKFATVLGNPPYVRARDVAPSTQAMLHSALLDGRANLYLHFIEKCVNHLSEGGELIFITPRDFLKATSSTRLNEWLGSKGRFTHMMDLGDARIFNQAVPNCLIWRYQLGAKNDTVNFFAMGGRDDWRGVLNAPTWQARNMVLKNGHWHFSSRKESSLILSDIAAVRVGAVSGDDEIFAVEGAGANSAGAIDFVYSGTVANGQTRKMLWTNSTQQPPPTLIPHKARLIARKIRRFGDNNWWQWGRGYPQTNAPRVYVNCKTRKIPPFFTHPCQNYDGAVMAIFPHTRQVNIDDLAQALNALNWSALGFVCDGRYLFSQRSLANVPLPDSFNRFFAATR